MKHATTREIFAYWNTLRGDRNAPERTDLDPGAISHALGDVFILEYCPEGDHSFRLAGTRLCALFGGELKGRSFRKLWDDDSIAPLQRLVTILRQEQAGLVAHATGVDERGEALDLELLLLPLSYRNMTPSRLLGSLCPLTRPYWLGMRPLTALTLGMYRHLDPAVEQGLLSRTSPAPLRMSRKPHLTVYEGGRR